MTVGVRNPCPSIPHPLSLPCPLSEQELGRETMITRVCSSPLRDRRKVLGNVDPQKRPRLSVSPTPPPPPPTYSHLRKLWSVFVTCKLHCEKTNKNKQKQTNPAANLSSEPHPMLETDGTPDEDGYYSFTVSVPGKPERMSGNSGVGLF